MKTNLSDLEYRLGKGVDTEDLAWLENQLERLTEELELLTEESGSGTSDRFPFSPFLQPSNSKEARELRKNVEEVQEGLGLDFANRVSRAKRLVEYKISRLTFPDKPVVVSEADSWGQYPFRLLDLVDNLQESFNVRSLGAAGDTVQNMVAEGEFLDAIGQEKPIAFFFSGGGNDLLGGGRVEQIVKTFQNGVDPDDLIDEEAFDLVLSQVINGYIRMVEAIRREFPSVPVFSHGYDYVANLQEGPWIWPHLEAKGYDNDEGHRVIWALIDRFNRALHEIDAKFDEFNYVDLRNTVGKSRNSWHDAIHPKNPGFERAAEKISAAIFGKLGSDVREASLTQFSGRNEEVGSEPINEAIVRYFGFHDCADEPWKRLSENRNKWRRFSDPLVHKHIEDVLKLLGERDSPEDPNVVANRLATKPAEYAAQGGLLSYREDSRSLREALIAGNEIEPIQTLLEGYRAGQAVGRIKVMSSAHFHRAHGSGFLIAPGLLMTNHHVLQSPGEAGRSFVVFNHEEDLRGGVETPHQFRITSDIYYSSVVRDFAIVSVEAENRFGKRLSDFGLLPLIQLSGKAIKGEPASILQHPGGGPKAVAVRNSVVMGRIDDGVYYTTDTLPGSSGSPLLNTEWQVVGLHHRQVPHPIERGQVLANRGVRISSICEAVHNAARDGDSMAIEVWKHLDWSRNTHDGDAERSFAKPRELEPAHLVAGASMTSLGSEAVENGVYSGLTNAEFEVAISKDDADEWSLDDQELSSDIPLPDILQQIETEGVNLLEALSTDRESVLRRVGERGYRFIVAHEVSSKENYDRRLKNPILPGGSSGITIGIGYDLGFQTIDGFRANWRDLLSDQDAELLERCIGKTRGDARTLLPSVKSIVIPYEDAITVFERDSLPRFFRALNRHIKDDVLDELHPHCIAALVSLTFNRGASFANTKARFREMRAIKADLNARRFSKIPDHLRSMIRLWEGKPRLRGVVRRRKEEAELFEDGLSASQKLEGARTKEDSIIASMSDDEITDAFSEGIDEGISDEISAENAFAEAARPRLSISAASWVTNHKNSPDTWHLSAEHSDEVFELDAQVINGLIEVGHYQPVIGDHGKLILALRGCQMVDADDFIENETTVRLRVATPDHENFRCLIGVFDNASERMSLYLGSTIPRRTGMRRYYNRFNFGDNHRKCNLLPTGCYEYCVGTHFGTAGKLSFVLRLGDGPNPANSSAATVLRTVNDLIYGTVDVWDHTTPGDNIHPAILGQSFSSLGCLTVRGNQQPDREPATATREWRRFQEAGEFHARNRGERYDNVLTTGLEAANVAAALKNGSDLSELSCLRHGSRGAVVQHLQLLIGAGDDSEFGAGTKKKLVERQIDQLGFATGTWTPKMADAMGMSFQ